LGEDTDQTDDLKDPSFESVCGEDTQQLINELNTIERMKIGKTITRGLTNLRNGGSRVGHGDIILDTGSKVSIFKDKSLFGRIMEIKKRLYESGTVRVAGWELRSIRADSESTLSVPSYYSN